MIHTVIQVWGKCFLVIVLLPTFEFWITPTMENASTALQTGLINLDAGEDGRVLVMTDTNTSVLTIQPVEPSDAGTMSVCLTSSLGSDHVVISIHGEENWNKNLTDLMCRRISKSGVDFLYLEKKHNHRTSVEGDGPSDFLAHHVPHASSQKKKVKRRIFVMIAGQFTCPSTLLKSSILGHSTAQEEDEKFYSRSEHGRSR
ncbi:hypothetical protein Btru_047908 [Bulinus truncatus]|nr:hypothetical protein Btru_047908 [Bulinus truncatus]